MLFTLRDIKIQNGFLLSKPSREKFERIEKDFLSGKPISKDIIIDQDNQLIDGYIRYLVLRKYGVLSAEITMIYVPLEHRKKNISIKSKTKKRKKSKYIFAKHKTDGKEYVWRITPKTEIESLEVGGCAIVETKYGLKPVTITKIEELENPPVSGKIRRVRRCYERLLI